MKSNAEFGEMLKEFSKAKPWYWQNIPKPDKPNVIPRMPSIARTKPMHDHDGDGFPNIIDCEPLDPNKQGLGTFIKEKIEAYKANAPARKEQSEQRTQ